MMEQAGTAGALLARDRVAAGVLRAAAALAGGITLLIVTYLVLGSLPALRAVGPLRFLADPSWNPVHGAWAALFWKEGDAGRLVEHGAVGHLFESPKDELTAAYVRGRRG